MRNKRLKIAIAVTLSLLLCLAVYASVQGKLIQLGVDLDGDGNMAVTGTSTFTTVDINAGAIDNTAIGATTPSTGAFTTLSATGALTGSSNATFDSGTVQGSDLRALDDLVVEDDTVLDGDLHTTGIANIGGDLVAGSYDSRDHVRVVAFSYYDVDVAANQAAAEWGVDPSAGVGGANFKQIPMVQAGSVVGLAVYSNAACTSGTLVADATINGSVTGLQTNLDSVTSTTVDRAYQAKDTDTFSAGGRVGVKVTTNATWAPTTADVVAVVYVEY